MHQTGQALQVRAGSVLEHHLRCSLNLAYLNLAPLSAFYFTVWIVSYWKKKVTASHLRIIFRRFETTNQKNAINDLKTLQSGDIQRHKSFWQCYTSIRLIFTISVCK